MSPVADLLGVRYPLLLAPMAAVSGGRLAAAVSRACGLGFIGGGYCDRDWLVEQLRLCAGQPFGVGFITWALRRSPGLLELALQAKPRAVYLSLGDLPAQQALLAQARARGDFDITPVIAGEAVDLVRARRPAAEVVGDLVARCIELLGPDHPLAPAHFSSHPA